MCLKSKYWVSKQRCEKISAHEINYSHTGGHGPVTSNSCYHVPWVFRFIDSENKTEGERTCAEKSEKWVYLPLSLEWVEPPLLARKIGNNSWKMDHYEDVNTGFNHHQIQTWSQFVYNLWLTFKRRSSLAKFPLQMGRELTMLLRDRIPVLKRQTELVCQAKDQSNSGAGGQ